jgi:hypothetical protein
MNAELMEFLVGKKTPPPTSTSTPGKKNDSGSTVTPVQRNSAAAVSSSSSRKGKGSTTIASASFYKVLVQQYLDSDRFAEDVLRSIVNLQDRLRHEMVLVERMKSNQAATTKLPPLPWKSYGYRHDQQDLDEGLTLDDINMTLDRDLLQHEAMLSQLRRMVSTMAQAQDAMGRRLSEWYNNEGDDDDDDDGLETAQSLYVTCAQELYRKQIMVQSICDKAAMDLGNALSTGSVHVRSTTARECLTIWNRSCAESYLAVKKDEIKSLIQRYEQ